MTTGYNNYQHATSHHTENSNDVYGIFCVPQDAINNTNIIIQLESGS